MSTKTLSSVLAVLLLVSVVAPTAFFVAPQRAHAQQYGSCIGGLLGGAIGGVAGAVTAVPVNSTVGNTINTGTWGSTLGTCINQFVIQPLIRAAIHALIQKLTATIINWINGGNGTGQPSYVQNLPGHLQNVGDTQALAFFAQIGTNSNSPFAAAITSSLATSYLQNTSSAGFFAGNKDTFITTTGSAANANAFLAGNWSQGGGTSAWFALTTQPQNNPYTLYQSSQSHLGTLVTGAQNNRLNELSWANGFLAWCGPAGTGNGTGTAKGNTCTNKDGSPGMTQTPGTIIAGYANQAVVQAGFQQLFSASDIDGALNAIIQALIGQVLGGVNGLFGAGGAGNTGGGVSLTDQLQTYAGAPVTGTATQIVQGQILQTAQTQTNQYQSAWAVLRATANFASTALTKLSNSCPAQATPAQTAITSVVTPILTRADSADAITAAALAMIQQVQNEQNSGDPAYSTDLQILGSMPPSSSDVSSAQQATQSTGGAVAAPAGSLNVSGGTTIDQLALIAVNAAALQAACP